MVAQRILPNSIPAVFGALLGCVLITACSGDKEPDDSQRIVEATATDSPVDGLPDSDLRERFERFESGNGYSIEHPSGWNVEEDAGEVGPSITFDSFTAPQMDGDFLTNINVLCEQIPGDIDTSEYVDANVNTYRAQGVDAEVVGEIPAGGDNAVLVEYSSSILERNLDFSQALLAADGCGWVITLTAQAGLRAEYKNIFLAMVESFEPE